jgi:hypothetical protein
MKLSFPLTGLATLALLCVARTFAYGQTEQAKPAQQSQGRAATTAATLDVDDLKIAMAESSLQVNPSLRTTSDLASALESTISKSCFGDALRTLEYSGNPTDPNCVAKMERLLQLYPMSPVGICLRDGFEAESCGNAYQTQTFAPYGGGSGSQSLQDPALKVGLAKRDRDKLSALSATLEDVNKRYQASKTASEKQSSIDDATRLYDQLLGIACRVSAVSLEDQPGSSSEPVAESGELVEIRQKIMKLPPGLRAEHQERMLQKAEEELGQAKDNKEKREFILKKIQVIQTPEIKTVISTEGKLRVRVVLPECFELVRKAENIIPNLPSPICHRVGWHSPQCVLAIKSWHAYRKQLEAQARKTDPKYATPTPKPIISTF